jgi:hypothetical protein
VSIQPLPWLAVAAVVGDTDAAAAAVGDTAIEDTVVEAVPD